MGHLGKLRMQTEFPWNSQRVFQACVHFWKDCSYCHVLTSSSCLYDLTTQDFCSGKYRGPRLDREVYSSASVSCKEQNTLYAYVSARGKERCIDAHCYLLRASLLQEIMLCCDLVKYLDTILMALTKVLCSLVH